MCPSREKKDRMQQKTGNFVLHILLLAPSPITLRAHSKKVKKLKALVARADLAVPIQYN
jgi:hypothetical protein